MSDNLQENMSVPYDFSYGGFPHDYLFLRFTEAFRFKITSDNNSVPINSALRR